jgi:hypothetical protein
VSTCAVYKAVVPALQKALLPAVDRGNNGNRKILSFVSNALPTEIDFTRASTGTALVSDVLTTFAVDAPRLSDGLLIEGSSTNHIPNSEQDGVTAPTTMPTGWTTFIGGGLSREIVGIGTENGWNYFDYRFYGTASGSSGASVTFSGVSDIAASQGETWTVSMPIRIVGGDLNDVSNSRLRIIERTAGGSAPAIGYGSNINSELSSTFNRYEYTYELTDATTAFIQGSFEFIFTSGAVIDVTFRMYEPQLEESAKATSYIRTSGSAATRSDDVAVEYDLSRTNYIRNSVAAGANVGSDTLPTNWTRFGGSGISLALVGAGEGYVDIRWSGTATGNIVTTVRPEGITTQIAAAIGQIWNNAFTCSVLDGDASSISSFTTAIITRDGSGNFLTEVTSDNKKDTLSATETRYASTLIVDAVSTAYIVPAVRVTFSSGQAVDFTLRIKNPQLERRPLSTSTATAYIPTSGSAVTVYDSPLGFNPTEGTFVVEFTPRFLSKDFQTILSVGNGQTANMNCLRIRGDNDKLEYAVFNNTTGQVALPLVDPAVAGTRYKVAFAYKANDFAASVNGGTPETDNTGILQAGIPQLFIGSATGTTRFANSVIERITYYPTRLSNTRLQELTS